MSIPARGGYQIVDFKNIGISIIPVTIPGIYSQARNADKKPCLACNLTIKLPDEETYTKFDGCEFVPAYIDEDDVYCLFDLIGASAVLKIESTDTVTLARTL